MATKTIDANMLAKMFLAGAQNIEAKKEFINELNVRIVHVRDEISHFEPFFNRDGGKVRFSILLSPTYQNIDRISCIKILND